MIDRAVGHNDRFLIERDGEPAVRVLRIDDYIRMIAPPPDWPQYRHRQARLKPEGAAERNILFQSVTPAGGRGMKFAVSVIIRDYEKDYPPNRYYGRTCVSRITDWWTAA